jgi:hypothetical protein
MLKRKILALAALLPVSAVCVTGAWAQVTVSGGFALSSVENIEMSYAGGTESPTIDSDMGLGGNLFVDYLLPLNFPMSLGFELGFDSASFKSGNGNYVDTMSAVPLLLRAAYHFDILPKLDLYVVGKIGYVIGIWEGDSKDQLASMGGTIEPGGGIGFGFDAGAAYYFNSKVGVFAEVGFDQYALETKVKILEASATLKVPFNRFLTAGISGKF